MQSLLSQIANPSFGSFSGAMDQARMSRERRDISKLQEDLLRAQIAEQERVAAADAAKLGRQDQMRSDIASGVPMGVSIKQAAIDDPEGAAKLNELFRDIDRKDLREAAGNFISAVQSGQSEQDAFLKRAKQNLRANPILANAVQETIDLGPGPERDAELIKTAMLIKNSKEALGLSLDERKVSVSEGKLGADQARLAIEQDPSVKDLAERGMAVKEGELKVKQQAAVNPTTKQLARSPLGKLIAERNTLPEGSPDRAAYDQAITKSTTDSAKKVSDEMVKNLSLMVVDGRLNPNMISKRGGLQQAVFSHVEQNFPQTDLVELEANARFKNTAGNLTSRALINGVTPLYDSLIAAGETLDNGKFPVLNRAVNFAKEQTGDPDIVAFNNLRDDVIAETERILLNTGVLSDTKYVRALKNVNSAQSFPQLKAAVAQMEFVVESRLQALDKTPFTSASPSNPASPAQADLSTLSNEQLLEALNAN